MSEVFVARQPIFNRRLQVAGYELLFRGGDATTALVCDKEGATASVVQHERPTVLTVSLDLRFRYQATAPMLLYDSAVSGNCYKVRQLLAHLGIECERRELSVIDRSNSLRSSSLTLRRAHDPHHDQLHPQGHGLILFPRNESAKRARLSKGRHQQIWRSVAPAWRRPLPLLVVYRRHVMGR